MARPGLTLRLFLVLLALGATLVLAMAVATRFSVQTGMVDYVVGTEFERLKPMAEQLESLYRDNGNWAFLRGNRRLWARLLIATLETDKARADGDAGHRAPEPGDDRPETPPPADRLLEEGLPGEHPPPSDRDIHRRFWRFPDTSGLPPRVHVLDAEHRPVAGFPLAPGSDLRLRSLTVDGRIVGYLGLTTSPLVKDGLEQGFLDRQLLILSAIAGAALVIALAAAGILGRSLGRPILQLAGAVRNLASGDYRTRVDILRRDELGALGDDINRLAQTLERNESLRREAMADVSHELRTPIALLRANIEAMQDGVQPTGETQLAGLHDAVLRLGRLVDDLYDMALADAGVLSYQRELLDWSELVAEAVTAARPAFREAGLTIETQLDRALSVRGDTRRLRQVLDNLLQNCLRYTDAGGRVVLALTRDGEEARLSLEDSAPGVPETALPQLFQRFFRVESSRSRASGGAGLGLAIVRTIVLAHGGDIIARASALGGLNVTIRLPLAGPANG